MKSRTLYLGIGIFTGVAVALVLVATLVVDIARRVHSKTIILEKSPVSNELMSHPKELRVPDLRIYNDGTAIYKKDSGKFSSKDFELYSGKLTSKEINDTFAKVDKNGFFKLPEKIGTNDDVLYSITVNYRGRSRKVRVTDSAAMPDTLKQIVDYLTGLKAGDETLFVPKKVWLTAVELTGQNAKNVRAQQKPKPWRSGTILLRDIAGAVHEYEGQNLEEILALTDREFLVYLIEDNRLFQTLIKWQLP